jgi:TonB family protein
MRKIVSPAILSLLLLSLVFAAPAAAVAQVPATAQTRAAWETYTFYGEEFHVSLPEMPTLDHSTRYINGLPDKDGTARNYGAYYDDVVYLIRAHDKPREGEDLNYFAKDYVRSLVRSDQRIEIKLERELLPPGKFSGRQYVVVRDSKPSSVPASSLYVFLTGRHAYVLRAVGGDDTHPDVQRFISSFALAEKPAGRQIVDESILPQPPLARATLAATLPAPKTANSPGDDPKSKGTVSKLGIGGEPRGAGRGENPGVSVGAASATAPPVGVSVDPNRHYKAAEVTRRALIIHKPEPLYTEKARENQVAGTIRLRIVLSHTGKVTDITAINNLPDGLAERAALAAKHIKFIPAVLEGRRVSQYILIDYNFNIY